MWRCSRVSISPRAPFASRLWEGSRQALILRRKSLMQMAEREGFEPSLRLLTVNRFSKPAPSATRPPLRAAEGNHATTMRVKKPVGGQQGTTCPRQDEFSASSRFRRAPLHRPWPHRVTDPHPSTARPASNPSQNREVPTAGAGTDQAIERMLAWDRTLPSIRRAWIRS